MKEHGIADSGLASFDDMRDAAIAKHGFAKEQEPRSEADIRREHFITVYLPRMPQEAVEVLRTLYSRGVWENSTGQLGATMQAVWGWNGQRRLLIAPTGRGKTLALTYCGVRWITHPRHPEAVAYMACSSLEDDSYAMPEGAATLPLFLLDEIHRLPEISTWKRTKLYSVIDRRYNARLPTVSASSASVETLRETLGDEWVDRLALGKQILKITDPKNWRRDG